MSAKENSGGLDVFRLLAAFLVVAIHTSPLASFSGEADFFLTRVLARLAVPFFFMVTGQLILSGLLSAPAEVAAAVPGGSRSIPRVRQEKTRGSGFSSIRKYICKVLLLYGVSILLYLPIGIYAGHYRRLTLSSLLRMLIFDGTFYHLWYFPALLLGILLLCLLRRFFSLKICTAAAAVLYLIGLSGDSYWGLTARIPALSSAYAWGFHFFSYTRNGLFFAPLFLLMGTRLTQGAKRKNPVKDAALFALSFLLMTAEGFALQHFNLQRHDSMYLLLPVCMYFLYRLLLSWKLPPLKNLRTVSTWIYILHPAVIVAVRGISKLLPGGKILTENSLLHYLSVCILSLLAALLITAILRRATRGGNPPKLPDSTPPDVSRHTAHGCGYSSKPPGSIHTLEMPRQLFNHGRYFAADRAWIELDRTALKHNVRTLRSLLPAGCALMPAVKANAYGHGAVLIAKELNRMGVDAFCAACISEGIVLRQNGIRGDILILGYTHPKQFPLLRHYRLTQTVLDYHYAVLLNQYGKRLHVHVGIDTGMHRLGERSEHFDRLCEIFQMKNLQIDGAYTHLCMSDTSAPDARSFTLRQAQEFYRVIGKLKASGFSCPKLHLLASYGILNYPELAGDYARVGIALYGVRSSRRDYDLSSADLHPVLSLKARVSLVKDLYPGESTGYGLSFTADRPMKIACLSIGYADGLPRSLSGGSGSVLLHGHKAPILGRICMDQTTVDVTNIPDVCAGDIAVLIGISGGTHISAYELAESAGTITNEILSRMGSRLPRILV